MNRFPVTRGDANPAEAMTEESTDAIDDEGMAEPDQRERI